MRQAAIHATESKVEPIVKVPGIRVNKSQILNEKDCIKIKARTWLDKKDWTQINDILRVQSFNGLVNGKDSCWIKMKP